MWLGKGQSEGDWLQLKTGKIGNSLSESSKKAEDNRVQGTDGGPFPGRTWMPLCLSEEQRL